MFETVVPEITARRSRKLFYETLPLSLAVHAVAVASAMAVNLWTVAFPQQSPKLYAAYSLTATPPPPPPPPPPPKPAGEIQPRPIVAKMPLVAPAFIPDEIPVLAAPLPDDEPTPPAASSNEGVEGGIEGGVAGGLIGGVIGGTLGGILDAPAPEVIEIRRDEPLPMGAIAQEFPAYPEFARSRGIEDTLVVRYVIGKDGRIKNVSVIKPPSSEDFTRATLGTIRHWRFHPFRDETGEPREVVHELTVEFRIKRVRK